MPDTKVKARPPQKLDVWLVEANKVYREVPYDVVADWVGQSRLLADDRVRPAGKGDWQLVAESAFAVYLPKAAPPQAEDAAEALEPVEAGFNWKQRPGGGDEEVDMIPLIDVSLVLLIFFMLTAGTAASVGSSAGLPQAEFGAVTDPKGSLWVRIDLEGRGKNRTPIYNVGRGGQNPSNAQPAHSTEEALQRLDELLPEDGRTKVEVTINAASEVEAGVVRDFLVKMDSDPKRRDKILKKYTGVSRKTP
jgi:biopolymer transport protein ExbD